MVFFAGEFLYVIFELVIGLITFATVLGFIANIVTNVSAARKDFQGKSWRSYNILYCTIFGRNIFAHFSYYWTTIFHHILTHFRYKRFMLNEKASKTMWCWWNKAAFIEKLKQLLCSMWNFFYSNSTCINIGLRVCRKQSEKICYTLNFPAVDFPCSQDK